MWFAYISVWHAAASATTLKIKMPSFHNTRWPLLTALLESKGWTRAAANTQADLSFVDDGTWQKEPDSPYPGRMRFFSGIRSLLSNKRSFAIGLRQRMHT